MADLLNLTAWLRLISTGLVAIGMVGVECGLTTALRANTVSQHPIIAVFGTRFGDGHPQGKCGVGGPRWSAPAHVSRDPIGFAPKRCRAR